MLDVASSGVEFTTSGDAFAALWPALPGQSWIRWFDIGWFEIGAARIRI